MPNSTFPAGSAPAVPQSGMPTFTTMVRIPQEELERYVDSLKEATV